MLPLFEDYIFLPTGFRLVHKSCFCSSIWERYTSTNWWTQEGLCNLLWPINHGSDMFWQFSFSSSAMRLPITQINGYSSPCVQYWRQNKAQPQPLQWTFMWLRNKTVPVSYRHFEIICYHNKQSEHFLLSRTLLWEFICDILNHEGSITGYTFNLAAEKIYTNEIRII